jgi:Mg2+-importing ATPase
MNGHVVGYLGDGINDAASLQNADVGLSVENAVDVAKESADMILTNKSLDVLKDGIISGRKTFANTLKYTMMGVSSNFGNMFSVLGAVLFLPFLPMLPMQILLNNLLYDISQITIPADTVDAEDIHHPRRWHMQFLRNFMIVFGSISSIFDFITFFILYRIFHLTQTGFQTGWFLESLATQTLVIYIIRTRRTPFLQSSPEPTLFISTIVAVAVGWLLPFTGLGKLFGFTPLPPLIFSTLIGVVLTYLSCVEIAKRFFFTAHRALK